MLHDQFVQQTKEEGNQDRWEWLQNRTLNHKTESLISSAQEQSIRTNPINGKKSQEQAKCRMCSRIDETINHIVSECHKRKSTKESMIESEDVFIEKFEERKKSMLNQNGMSRNHKWSLRMTIVKYFRILLQSHTILYLQKGVAYISLIKNTMNAK